jgi:predicted Fe-S protein YdhL (DUF1289 family)
VSDLTRLLAAAEAIDPSGPAHLPHLGSRPGWSPDREFQSPAGGCTICGLPDDDLPESATIAPDPIVHGELATFVCEGCGRTRSRISWGGLHKPHEAVLEAMREPVVIYHDRPEKPRHDPPAPPRALAGGLGRSPLAEKR